MHPVNNNSEKIKKPHIRKKSSDIKITIGTFAMDKKALFDYTVFLISQLEKEEWKILQYIVFFNSIFYI